MQMFSPRKLIAFIAYLDDYSCCLLIPAKWPNPNSRPNPEFPHNISLSFSFYLLLCFRIFNSIPFNFAGSILLNHDALAIIIGRSRMWFPPMAGGRYDSAEFVHVGTVW